ncbi:unnamed protein product [Rotaria magnacalcarata]
MLFIVGKSQPQTKGVYNTVARRHLRHKSAFHSPLFQLNSLYRGFSKMVSIQAVLVILLLLSLNIQSTTSGPVAYSVCYLACAAACSAATGGLGTPICLAQCCVTCAPAMAAPTP